MRYALSSSRRPMSSWRFHRATGEVAARPSPEATTLLKTGASARRRWRRRSGGKRQHFVSGVGDQHGVLPLRGQAVIRSDDGPTVGEAAYARATGVDHRLDREHHARLQLEPGARTAVMQHLRFLVELSPDTVPAELAHDREAVALRVALDRRSDIAQVCAGLDRANAAPHGFVRDL